MPEQALPELPARLERLRSRPTAKAGDWYRIEAKAGAKTATVSIYDEIGWGTNAKDFAAELRAIDAEHITLRLNSPGGDAWDGTAIYNSLRDHPAKVTVVVDGIAASAASFIAQAGDRVVMNRGSQMMIHDPAGLVMGNADDMREFASVLDKAAESIAGIYAARSGRPLAEHRAAMLAETWYTAAEAVEAGLADEVAADPDQPPATNTAPARVTAAEAARRIHAAAQKTTTAIQAGDASQKGAGHVDPAKIREALGLPADASDGAVRSALESAGVVSNSTTPQPTPAPAPEPTPTPSPSTPPAPSTPRPTAAGTMVIDQAAWDAQQDAIKRLEAADARRRRDERDQVINQAVLDGKFPPARKDHWVRLWDADPEGTRQVIDGLARNVMPVAALGYAGDGADADFEMEFAGLFPPSGKKG